MFPPCYLTSGQTMVEVMKTVGTSFKRSHARTATFSVTNPAADHRRLRLCRRLLDTNGQVWVSLLWCHCSFSPGSWCTQGSVCALQESVSQSCVSSGSSMVGLMATSSKRAYAILRSTAHRAPAPPLLTCTSSKDTQILFCLSLCGVSGSW